MRECDFDAVSGAGIWGKDRISLKIVKKPLDSARFMHYISAVAISRDAREKR